jgi:RNA polymerase sigma factor (sigma-70 family)
LEVDQAVVSQLQLIRRSGGFTSTDHDTVKRPIQCDALPARSPSISLEERLMVIMAVEELTQRERTVVLGTFAAGLSQSEIALTLGLSQSQVSKILGRALEKLHKRVA